MTRNSGWVRIGWLILAGFLLPGAFAATTVLPDSLKVDMEKSPFEMRMVTGVAPFYLYDASWEYRTRYWDDQFHRYYDSDDGPNYVVEHRFESALPRYEKYVKAMAGLGCNAIMLGDVIHLVTYDDLVPGNKYAIYSEDSPFRRRHEYYKKYFRKLIDIAKANGMEFYVYTDEYAYSDPLKEWVGELNVRNEKLWTAYQAKYDELFTTFPDLAGVILRFGELYPTRGYGGKDIVQSAGYRPEDFRTLIRKTWEVVCKKHGKTYVHRTWSLGLETIGAQPWVYERIWDGLPTEGILVSVKHSQTDFWYYNARNPTLGMGKHKQIVEFQTRREYYGMGLYPDMPIDQFVDSMRLAKRLDNVVGYWVWPNEGGGNNNRNLRPQAEFISYIQGLGAWNEANTYLVACLGASPEADIDDVLSHWAGTMYGEKAAANVVQIMKMSSETVQAGHHISDWAKQHVWRPQLTVNWFMLTQSGLDPYKQPLLPAEVARMAAESKEGAGRAREQVRLFEEVSEMVPDQALARETLAGLREQAALYELVGDYRKTLLYYFQARGRAADEAAHYLEKYDVSREDLEASVADYEREFELYDTGDVHGALELMKKSEME